MSCAQADLRTIPGNLIGPRVRFLLTTVHHTLTEQGIESYVVGGLVRDILLERDTVDIDLAISADALEVVPRIAASLGGKAIVLDEVNRLVRIILPDEKEPSGRGQWQLDFSTLIGSISQDLARRDFTINALAINLDQLTKQPDELQLIDLFNGWKDLHHRTIRAVTEGVFVSDAVRLLRAVRLAAELGFNIDKDTEALIKRDAHLVITVAGERIREELMRLLSLPGAVHFLVYLDELGLLTAIFPELAAAQCIQQPKEHYWDVFNHCLNTVGALEFLMRQGEWNYAHKTALAAVLWSAELSAHFDEEVNSGSTRRSLLKLAALLHDIAKPQTKAIDATGRTRFLGHAIEGATVVGTILERLRFSTRETKLVAAEVKYHLWPGQMSQAGLPTKRAIYRYFRDTEDAGIDILFLNMADHLATRGPNFDLERWQEHAKLTEYILQQRFQEQSIVHPAKLIDGHDLVNVFGLTPGPKLGEILEQVREAQASGEITTREEALSFVQRLLGS